MTHGIYMYRHAALNTQIRRKMSIKAASSSTAAPYGKWKSPITASHISSKSLSFQEVRVHEPSGKIYLLESRPAEEGRCCIVDCGTDDGQKHVDVLPKGYSARTGVHEYGGAAFAVGVNGGIVFADWETKGVYSLSPGSRDCISLLEADPEVYYADFDIHPINSALILAVQENHHPKVVENSIVLIDALSRKWHTIASGADFYSHPKFSAEGDKVCWLQWNHPDMPWTGSLLYVGSWDGGAVSDAKVVAGEPGKESISQPRWLPDGSLLFASDRSGYYQLYLLDPGQRNARHINLHGLSDVEFAGPEWVLGT